MPVNRKAVWALIGAATIGGAGYGAATGRFTLPFGLHDPVVAAANKVAGYAGVTLTSTPSAQIGPTDAAPAAGQRGPGGGAPGAGGGGGGAQQRPPVSVRLAKAEKRDMPVRFEAIGTVQPLASVVVRSRVDSQILAVEFHDGARVKKGDHLFRLDARQIDAQIKQAEGTVLRAKATLELNELDAKRKEALSRVQASSQALLDTSRANVATAKAQLRADEAALDNLKVQRTFYDILAPISGRVGIAGLKEGNIARQGEAAQVLATINQISPIYVAFPVPQRLLPELRDAAANNSAEVSATPQGLNRAAKGRVSVLENSVDAATGTILVRAEFDNDDEILWPGSLSNVRVTLRTDPGVIVVPRLAVMNGQQGQYVFAVDNNVATIKPIVVDRVVDDLAIIKSG
ncbi:MAG: efflux RND transporter periplasmic adaptor subunit, partial [Beijerinckiaceae bacterium]